MSFKRNLITVFKSLVTAFVPLFIQKWRLPPQSLEKILCQMSLPPPGLVSRQSRESFLDELDSSFNVKNEEKCRCSLSFAALLLRPHRDTSGGEEADGRENISKRTIKSVLSPQADLKTKTGGNVALHHSDFSKLPDQFYHTALSAALPLHRCEAHRLIRCLPQQYHNSQWLPIFDTKVDGYSLSHFYRTLQKIRDLRPSIKAAIGFFEVLTREQWEEAMLQTNNESSQIRVDEQATPHLSIYNSSNTARGPVLHLNTSSPSVSASAVGGTLGPLNMVNNTESAAASPPGTPLCSSARAALLERVSSWHSVTETNNEKPTIERDRESQKNAAEEGSQEETYTQMNLSTPTVIGVFAPIMPSLERGHHQFFGSRDTAVFAFTDVHAEWTDVKARRRARKAANKVGEAPTRQSSSTEPLAAGNRDANKLPRHFRYHRWSGENEEFLVCAPDYLGVGGGEGGASLYVDGDIQFGTSATHSRTFGPSLEPNAKRAEAIAAKLALHKQRVNTARKSAGKAGTSDTQGDAVNKEKGPMGTAMAGSLFGTQIQSLNQTEFFIARMQWFGIDESRYVDLCSRVGVMGSSSPIIREDEKRTKLNPNAAFKRQMPRKEAQLAEDNLIVVPPEVRAAIASDIGAAATYKCDSYYQQLAAHHGPAGCASALKGAVLCGCGGQGPSAIHACDGY